MAAAVLAAAVIASAAVTALLWAAGAAGGSTTAVVAQSTPAPGGSTAAGALTPSALYRGAATGVVAIAATGVSSGSNGLPYTPPRQSINIGTDSSNDASVLHVNPAGLTLHPSALGSTDSLVVGDPLAVIGNPFGYNRSLSAGVISGLERTIQAPNGSRDRARAADRRGLVTAVNGTAVTGPSQLVADLAALKPGEKVTRRVKRGPNTATLSAQASPSSQATAR